MYSKQTTMKKTPEMINMGGRLASTEEISIESNSAFESTEEVDQMQATLKEKLDEGAPAHILQPVEAAPAAAPSISTLRQWLIVAALLFVLFLTSVESTIVGTSLVAISNSLGGYVKRSWVVTAYLISYTGLLTTFSALARVMGSRFMMMVAVFMFTAFSIGCGFSQNMNTLIVLRALQGIGASGIFALCIVILATISKTPNGASISLGLVSGIFTVSRVVGPLIGGLISDRDNWRWIFFLNGPGGFLAFIILLACLTSNMEAKKLPETMIGRLRMRIAPATWLRLDLIGAALLVATLALLSTALAQGAKESKWQSASTIAFFCCSGLAFAGFIVRERHVLARDGSDRLAFPIDKFLGRQFWGLALVMFFTGFISTPFIYSIPQQLQIIRQYSATKAGAALLPLMISSPVFGTVSSLALPKIGGHLFWPLMVGNGMVMIGSGLLLHSTKTESLAALYTGQAVLGSGLGLSSNVVNLMAGVLVPKHQLDAMVWRGGSYLPAGMAGSSIAALTQIRLLGGTVAVAITSAIVDARVWASLKGILSLGDYQAFSNDVTTIKDLEPALQTSIRDIFRDGFANQDLALLIASAVSLVAALLAWDKKKHVDAVDAPNTTEATEATT